MTENNRIANLYAYLKRTRADEIIVRTTLVAGCWDDNECDAHAPASSSPASRAPST